jgi:hypothetical protein
MKSIANRKKNAHHNLLQRRQKQTIFALSLAHSLFRTVARTIIQTEGIGRRGLLGTRPDRKFNFVSGKFLGPEALYCGILPLFAANI